MSDPYDLTFRYSPDIDDDSLIKPGGVTTGWLYLWTGKPGPARVVKVQALSDEEGNGTIVLDGDWQDCQVIDDTAT